MVQIRLSHLLGRVILLSLFLNSCFQAEALLLDQLERGDGSFPHDLVSDGRIPTAQGLLGALTFIIDLGCSFQASLVFYSVNRGASGYLSDIDGPSSDVPVALFHSTCLRSLRLAFLRPILLHHLRIYNTRMQI